jgi:hypothetical protein
MNYGVDIGYGGGYGPDFVKLMEGFGALGKRVEKPEDIKPALAWAVQQSNQLRVPALVEVRVERETDAAMGVSIDKIIEREPVVDLPAEVHDALDRRTNETWPTTWFVPRCSGTGNFCDPYTVMNNWGANHGAVSFGHVGADLLALASVLRIPVAMHNVPEAQLFRPTAWGLFGAQDPQGADYRACANFGPIYA